MNIAYSCNEAYMEQTTVSIISLLENNSNVDDITVYFIDAGTSEDSRLYLRRVVESYNRNLIVVPLSEIAYDLRVKNTGRHIETVYAKLFFGRLKSIDRILYLDSDTVIVDDLSDFYNCDLEGYYGAGVLTIIRNDDLKKNGIKYGEDAFNDGVFLMNLDMWRKEKVLEKCKNFIEMHNGEPPVLSEGTINNVCCGKIRIVSPRFNLSSGFIEISVKKIEEDTGRKFYSQEILTEAIRHPAVIHYLSGFYNRPWCSDCTHPMKSEYLKYRSMTKWKDEPLSDKKLPFRTKMIGFLYRKLPIKLFKAIRKIT